MKISWFSPVPPDHTDIANYTSRLLPALVKSFDTTVYTESKSKDNILDGICQVNQISESSIDWKPLQLGGVPIYNIGNNIHFHGEIINICRKCPGIVVLHDLSIHETILNLCLNRGHGRTEYFSILNRFGGTDAVSMGKAFLDEGKFCTNQLSESYPLFQYVLDGALGIITHNPLNVSSILEHTKAPVMYSPLPYMQRDQLDSPVDRKKRTRSRYKIVIFGFLGSSNRRLQQFLEAFANSGCQDKFEIIVAGKYSSSDLNKWVKALSIGPSVKQLGFLPDEDLDGLLEDADLCINLRWPSRGEASGTLLRTWNQSLPVMVTRTAFYSTLPKNTVAFVDPANEQADIITHLREFSLDPDPYFELGLAAREHLSKEHAAEVFTKHLEAFLPEVEKFRSQSYPQVFGKNLTSQFLVDYPDPVAREELLKTCAREVSLWGPSP